MNKPGRLIVISAASGTGKSTVIKEVMKQLPDLVFSVSSTTRKARDGEREGVHYHFLTHEEFKRRIEENRFVEWEEVYGEFYGTEHEALERNLKIGKSIILDIDVMGGEHLHFLYPDAILIFLYPPSFKELRRRINSRGSENPDIISERLARFPLEKEKGNKYPFRVVNDDVQRAASEVVNIIKENS
ncbi:guanylate kinase [bacterium]|nr:guanylate kinase [bacterium]